MDDESRERPVAEEIEDDEATTRPAADHTKGRPAPADSGPPPEQRPIVISHSQVSGLRGTSVTIDQSSVAAVTAERIDLDRSSAQRVEGRLVQMERSQAVRVEGTRVVAEQTRVGGLIADQARFVRSRVMVVVARQAEVSAESRVFVHLGPLRSSVRPAVSTRTAAAFGAGVGLTLVAGLRLFGRRSR